MDNYTKNFFNGILIFIQLIIIQNAFSQGKGFKSYEYKWENDKPNAIPVDEKYKNNDAVILQEDNMIWLVENVYSKHIRVKYLNEKGVKNNCSFVLPESFDPLADKFDLEFSKRDSVNRPKGEFNSIRYFAPRIIKPDGRVVKAEYDYKTQSEIIRYSQQDHTFYSWTFNVKGVEPGDELEIQYAYEDIYNAKSPYRVYFHGILPKQNYSLKMRYKNGNLFFYQYHNGAEPQDSAVNKTTTPETYEYTWTRKNLDGCINEKGARIHRELPFVTFYQHHYDYNDQGMEVLQDAKQYPYPWEFIYRTMIGYYPKHPNYYLNKLDKNTTAIRNYFHELTDSLKDTSGYSKFLSIHKDITDNFQYDDDLEHFTGDDDRLERLPLFMEKKILRASSRYHIYNTLAFRTGNPYYKVNLYDKRFEEMDFNCFYPMEISQRFFSFPYKDAYLYFYPKHTRFGYDCNEFPFYYEDNFAMLIPQTIPEEETYKAIQNVKYVRVKTPYSSANDNTRNTISMISITLDSLKADFNTKLIMSGQFSTLTRGFYQYSSVDTTVNPGYYKPVYLLNGKTKLITKEMTSHIKIFPFTANFKLHYVNNSLIERKGDRAVFIPLKNFFNNITESVDTVANRCLSYYPDFQFTDQHKYILKFDKPVEIKDIATFNFSIKNSFGNYSCSLIKQQDETWLLETIFEVKNEKVAPENFHDVIEIYAAIQKMNGSYLTLNQ
ncbi:MAG: DUF3857 domain-containing protein [Bacteroidia bacterium]